MIWTVRRAVVALFLLWAGLVFAAIVYWSSSGLGTPAVAPASFVLQRVATTKPEIALTFDDGPSPRYTPQILAALKQYGMQGTFFALGSQMRQYPGLTAAIAHQGDELANHGMTHRAMTGLSPTRIAYELQSTSDLIQELSGHRPQFMRPPYGSYGDAVLQAARSQQLIVALWTIDTRDWTGRSAQGIAETVLGELAPGAIVLMHDGGGPRQHTVAALQLILRGLKERGYRAVTLSALLKDAKAPQREVARSGW